MDIIDALEKNNERIKITHPFKANHENQRASLAAHKKNSSSPAGGQKNLRIWFRLNYKNRGA